MGRFTTMQLLVDDLCTEIDYLKLELEAAREDTRFYREAYHKLLNTSIHHGEEMMAFLVKAFIQSPPNSGE
jgi:hypothetical protein